MRNIYKREFGETQQGCIFNGAITDSFNSKSVYGLIITPRCDIEQRKVSTVHYLPIIKLEDWKRYILTPISQKERLAKKFKDLKPLLDKHKVPEHISNIKYKLTDEDLSSVIPDPKAYKTVVAPLKDFWNLQSLDYCYDNLKSWNQYKNKITELTDGKNERYLLLERWDDDSKYYVICLTELYHITLSTALNLKDGIFVRDINFDENDLFKTDSMRDQYRILAQLSSPYIEYVTQHLSNAFFRIGIDDWDDRNELIQIL